MRLRVIDEKLHPPYSNFLWSSNGTLIECNGLCNLISKFINNWFWTWRVVKFFLECKLSALRFYFFNYIRVRVRFFEKQVCKQISRNICDCFFKNNTQIYIIMSTMNVHNFLCKKNSWLVILSEAKMLKMLKGAWCDKESNWTDIQKQFKQVYFVNALTIHVVYRGKRINFCNFEYVIVILFSSSTYVLSSHSKIYLVKKLR